MKVNMTHFLANATTFTAQVAIKIGREVLPDGKQRLEFRCELSNIQVTPSRVMFDVDWFIWRSGKATRVYIQTGILNPPFTVSEQNFNLTGLNLHVSYYSCIFAKLNYRVFVLVCFCMITQK